MELTHHTHTEITQTKRDFFYGCLLFCTVTGLRKIVLPLPPSISLFLDNYY